MAVSVLVIGILTYLEFVDEDLGMFIHDNQEILEDLEVEGRSQQTSTAPPFFARTAGIHYQEMIIFYEVVCVGYDK